MTWPDTSSAGLLAKLLMPNGTIVTGADTGTAAAGTFEPTALHVGRLMFNTAAGTNFQGDIAEILIYNALLSETDQQSVFSFLGNKYGVLSSDQTGGDFDGDGDVDGADFVAWQTHFPTTGGATLSQGDGNNDGNVDGADFAIWQDTFPTNAGQGVTPVPEPFSVFLLVIGVPILSAVRLRRRHVSWGRE
jgi:hypothetical protein